jgi:hypothetical protein
MGRDKAMPWSRSILIASVWAVLAVLILVPVAVIAADRFLPWGGLAVLGWGPPLTGIIAGLIHRSAKVGLLVAVGVLLLGFLVTLVMVVLALRSLPGP